jgi:hypothetical protein
MPVKIFYPKDEVRIERQLQIFLNRQVGKEHSLPYHPIACEAGMAIVAALDNAYGVSRRAVPG